MGQQRQGRFKLAQRSTNIAIGHEREISSRLTNAEHVFGRTLGQAPKRVQDCPCVFVLRLERATELDPLSLDASVSNSCKRSCLLRMSRASDRHKACARLVRQQDELERPTHRQPKSACSLFGDCLGVGVEPFSDLRLRPPQEGAPRGRDQLRGASGNHRRIVARRPEASSSSRASSKRDVVSSMPGNSTSTDRQSSQRRALPRARNARSTIASRRSSSSSWSLASRNARRRGWTSNWKLELREIKPRSAASPRRRSQSSPRSSCVTRPSPPPISASRKRLSCRSVGRAGTSLPRSSRRALAEGGNQ